MLEELALQPLASKAVTEYVPACVAVIACVVAPVDQRYDAAGLEVRVTLPPVGQIAVGPPAVIAGAAGKGWMLMVTLSLAEQPFASVTVSV